MTSLFSMLLLMLLCSHITAGVLAEQQQSRNVHARNIMHVRAHKQTVLNPDSSSGPDKQAQNNLSHLAGKSATAGVPGSAGNSFDKHIVTGGLASPSRFRQNNAAAVKAPARNVNAGSIQRRMLRAQGGGISTSKGTGAGGSRDALRRRKFRNAYVALVAIVKNEQPYLQEWVMYHRWIGVGRFYLFDHGSDPPVALQLAKLIRMGVVEVFTFQDGWLLDRDLPLYNTTGTGHFMSPQSWAYDNAFRWFGHRHTFIGMLDVDEHVVLRMQQHGRPNITQFLLPYEHHGGVMLHWQLLGPSGHLTRPTNGTMASYTQCVDKVGVQKLGEFQGNPIGFMKSFTVTKHYRKRCNPHMCVLDGAQYVNEAHQPISPSVAKELHMERAVIYHYVTRSKEEYAFKISRGSGHSQYSAAAQVTGKKSRGWPWFDLINQTATATCLEGVWLDKRRRPEGMSPQAVAVT